MIGEIAIFDSPLVAAVGVSDRLLAMAGKPDVLVSSNVPYADASTPDAYPDVFVTISRVGTNRVTPVHQETDLLFEIRSGDEGTAEDLADLLHALLSAVSDEVVGDTLVEWCKHRSGVVEYDDVERQLHRFQFVVVMRTRGRVLHI